jgi:hypothetical protein
MFRKESIMPGPKPQTPEETYAKLMKDAVEKDGCLFPTKKPMPAGYIQVRSNGMPDYAHRFIYEYHHGCLPYGMVVRHTCHNKNCIALAHLVAGTHADNVQDKVNAGRQPKGNYHYRASLTVEQVLEIRASPKSYAELSRIYGISRGGIKNIKDRKTWKHL